LCAEHDVQWTAETLAIIPEDESERSHKDTNELAAEVAVEPAVKKWIGAGGRHADQMTSGVDDGHLFFVFRSDEGVVHIPNEVNNVQWEPSDGENESDGYQQVVPPPQPLRKLSYSERILLSA